MTLQENIDHGRPTNSWEVHLVRSAWVIVVVGFIVAVIGGYVRGIYLMPDWRSWVRDVTYMWQHGEIWFGTKMFGYLPAVYFALLPFAVWLPKLVGLSLFIATNLLAAIGSMWIVYRWWLPADSRAGSFVWPVLLVLANIAHVIQANQLTLLTLFFCVAGLTLIERRGQFLGGMLIGVAVLIKIMPVILVGYVLLRRKWLAPAGIVVTVVLFDLLPSIAFFGLRGAVDEHLAWLRRGDWHSNTRQIDDPLFMGVHKHVSNFSYSAVLTRWLRAAPEAESLVVLFGRPPYETVQQRRETLKPNEWLIVDPMPARDMSKGQLWIEKRFETRRLGRFHLADLSARVVWWIWACTLTAGLAGLAWLTWKTRNNWPMAAALWMLAMLWLSPLMRHYYLALAFPAVAVVWSALAGERRKVPDRWSSGAVLAVAALTVWLVGQGCLGWHLARWYGVHLVALAALAAAAVWAWRRASTG